MADVSKLSLYGTTYTIKDSTARANANETKDAALAISYADETETIVIENSCNNGGSYGFF